jgi:hypothetical protein
MLFVYGDSHANFSFKNLPVPSKNYHMNSITMFRVGRDNYILNFNPQEHDKDSILCFAYGEIDCRCHVFRQKELGRDEDVIILELVLQFFRALTTHIKAHKKVIVVAVIPPIKKDDYERVHGPITHAFPFLGTDQDRVRYRVKVNRLLEALCKQNGYTFFNPYDSHYMETDGTLKYELSDTFCHLGKNAIFLDEFQKLLPEKIEDTEQRKGATA